jgi:hypothetical protein
MNQNRNGEPEVNPELQQLELFPTSVNWQKNLPLQGRQNSKSRTISIYNGVISQWTGTYTPLLFGNYRSY